MANSIIDSVVIEIDKDSVSKNAEFISMCARAIRANLPIVYNGVDFLIVSYEYYSPAINIAYKIELKKLFSSTT